MALARAVVVLNQRSYKGKSTKEEEEKGQNSQDFKLKLHFTEELVQLCCNKGFTSITAYQKHLREVETHSEKPLDPEGIRKMAEDAAMWEEDHNPDSEMMEGEGTEEWDGDGEEMEMMPNVEAVYEDDEDGDGEGGQEEEGEPGGEGEGEEEEAVNVKPVARHTGKRRKKGAKKSREKTKCEMCDLLIPATNIRRHIRVCHNPRHQFPCRYCSCRFLVAYGRMVHEVKNHRGPVGTQPPGQLRTAIKVKKKATQAVRPLPPTRALVKQQQGGDSIAQAKSVVANISEEEMAQFRSQIRKLGKTAEGGKSRYECLICNKTFLGSRNATDHMNSHYGLKPYKCPLCDFYFSFRSNVVRHVKTCHTDNSDFVCPYGCGCSMQSETSLKVHMNLVCTLRNQFQNSAPIKLAAPAMKLTANPSSTQFKMAAPSSSSAAQAGIAATEADLRSVSIHAGPRQLKEKYAHLEVSPGIYGCQYCGKTITGSGNFRDHLNIHLNIRPHKCPRCYMKFTFKSNIKRHLASAHVPNGTFKCPMKCGCQMDNQHALQSHLNKCKLEFPKHRREMMTQQAKSAKPPVKQQQPQLLKPQPQLQRIIKQEPDSNIGGQSASRPPPLQKVLPRPPPLTPAPKFVQQRIQQQQQQQQQQLLSTPMSDTESSPTTKYQCKVCHKSVSCRRNLDNHMLIHMNVKPCKCLICGLHFRTMDTLKKHNVKSHGVNSPFKCHLCPCRFSQVQGLNMHINIHHKVKAKPQGYDANGGYQDDLDQGYADDQEDTEMDYGAAEVQEQDEEVQGEPEQEVDDDEDSTAASDPIKINWNTARTKDGNFKCHLCGKVLKKGLHLRNHMRIHSGEKPFKCNLCGHRFRLASTLYDHKKSSHRGGNYHCDLCNCSFATNLGLSRHKGIFHNASIGTPTLTSSYQTQQYLQRKARFIKEKAVKSLMKPNTSVIFRGSTDSILKKRLAVQQKGSKPNIKSEPVGSEDVFQCGHCQLSLPSLHALSEHQRIHQNQKEEDHEASNGNASNPVDVKPQLLDLGDEAGPSPRKCPICNQGIHGRKHYNKHMRGCHSGGPYRCIYCPCSFDSQGNLSRHHTLMHANLRNSPRPNLSNVNKAPVASTSTASHQNVTAQEFEIENGGEEYYEEGEMSYQEEPSTAAAASVQDESSIPIEMTPLGKRYKCLDCGKMFDRLTRYKLHVTVHTDEKPYQCPNCDQRFRLPGILNTHIKKSHGNGEFRCSQCHCRFTSAKGLSVHEFVYHKGGRGATQGNNQRAGSSSQSMTIRNVPMNQMVKKILPKAQPQMMSEPRPVKLKCHICHLIFFGTTSLREHMKEHVAQSKVPSRMPSRQPDTTQQRASYSAGSRMQPQQTLRRSLPVQPFQEPHHFLEQDMETEDNGFEIVGYDNGYEEESVGHEEESQEYEYYEDGQNGQDDGYDYDYMNAEDHLEIVHENFGSDEGEEGGENAGTAEADNGFGYGLDLDMQPVDVEEEEAAYTYQQQEGEMDAITCKGCGLSFETRDAFAYHVESNESEGQVMCPYCCTQGINTETLPSHIEEFHTLDEVEFLEAQVYSDM